MKCGDSSLRLSLEPAETVPVHTSIRPTRFPRPRGLITNNKRRKALNTDMIKTLPGPDTILRKQFSNGVTVLIHENPWSSTAAIHGSLFAGSCLEPEDKTGLVPFLSAAITAGSRSGNFGNIGDHLESMGAALSFSSDPHAVTFKGNCLSEDLPDLLRLLKELLDEPVFPDNYLEVLRQRALGGYDLDMDESESPARILLREILWGEDHPYGRHEFGSYDIIQNITRNDLVDFHRRFFGPKKMILAIAGGFRSREIMDRCEEIFGCWDKAQENADEDALFPQVERWEECVRSHVGVRGIGYISLVIGTQGLAFNDPDILSARIGNAILGEFGLGGRVGSAVRVERGLAYSVFSSVEAWKKGGCWSVAADIDPAYLSTAGDLIYDELKRFTAEPVTRQELEDAKNWYIGSLPRNFVNNAKKASALHHLAFHHKDLDYYLRLPALAAALTPDSILETARRWIDPKALIICTTGPRDESKKDGWW